MSPLVLAHRDVMRQYAARQRNARIIEQLGAWQVVAKYGMAWHGNAGRNDAALVISRLGVARRRKTRILNQQEARHVGARQGATRLVSSGLV